eukprot:scaffold1484_cov173-Amphora_coffeaeformis.AAC.21
MGRQTTNNAASAKGAAPPPPPSTPRKSPVMAKQLPNRRGVKTPNAGDTGSRQISTPDPIVESTAVQRLVEYFVVLDSVPRWEKDQPTDDASAKSSSRKTKRRTLRKDRKRVSAVPEPPPDTKEASNRKTSGNIHLPEESRDYAFRPKITARYPAKDHSDNPLNPMISHFCYPTGDEIVPLQNYEMPRVHHFVLTNDKGRKVYGTCLTILEEYYPDDQGPWGQRTLVDDEGMGKEGMEVSVDNRRKALYLPKVLALLSTWPYLTAFREYMAQLYRLATATNIMNAPIERYIVNLCMEIPAPPPGAHEIQVNILDSTIRFWAPPAKLPIAYVALPFRILFECLDLENILSVWSALITERKVLLVSSQYSILTVVSEILCSLLFPMRWSHLYIPLLPRMLCPMLGAPVPYLCGIGRENWLYAQENLADDTIVVDLDKNRVSFGRETPPVPQLPIRRFNKLRTRLEECVGSLFWKTRGLESEYQKLLTIKPHKRSLRRLRLLKPADHWLDKLSASDHAFNLAYTPDSNVMDSWSDGDHLNSAGQTRWDMVQEAFLRFFVDLLKKYRKHLVVASSPGSNSQSDRAGFDHVSFLATQPSQATPFLSEMCMTQQFDDWITRRLFHPGEPDLVFFDQSIDAKMNRSKLNMKKRETPFLQNARAHKVLTTVKAVPPETEGLPRDSAPPFLYERWPSVFDDRLFRKPRPIPKMIAAEFDRQAVLVERLRAEREIDDDEELGNQFREEDFDPLHEVAAFNVFFFVYSALVGLDWQAYEGKRREDALLEHADDAHSDCENEEDASRAHEVILAANPSAKLVFVDPGEHKECGSCPNQSVAAVSSTFSLVGDSAEEVYTQAIEAASAQLDLAFEVLKALSTRGLHADMDAFRSLMQACGRCRNTERAIELTRLVKEHSLARDTEILSVFVLSFAGEIDGEIDIAEFESHREEVEEEKKQEEVPKRLSLKASKPPPSSPSLRSNPFPWLPRNVENDNAQSSDDESCSFDSVASRESSTGSFGFGGITEWLGNARPGRVSKTKKKKRKKSKKLERCNSTRYRPISTFVQAQVDLGENLLDYLYPDLNLDTNANSCPHCSYSLSESETVLGWVPRDFQDYTTQCPKCQHRFVPNFSVSCSSESFEGSQGKRSMLFCEMLSPWVLRKALGHVINGETGILGMLEPEWRSGNDIRATLFWNLIILCRRYRLPFGFLLQGSFQGRMILPRPPQEM